MISLMFSVILKKRKFLLSFTLKHSVEISLTSQTRQKHCFRQRHQLFCKKSKYGFPPRQMKHMHLAVSTSHSADSCNQEVTLKQTAQCSCNQIEAVVTNKMCHCKTA